MQFNADGGGDVAKTLGKRQIYPPCLFSYFKRCYGYHGTQRIKSASKEMCSLDHILVVVSKTTECTGQGSEKLQTKTFPQLIKTKTASVNIACECLTWLCWPSFWFWASWVRRRVHSFSDSWASGVSPLGGTGSDRLWIRHRLA